MFTEKNKKMRRHILPLILLFIVTVKTSAGQNISINILTPNSGNVNVGSSLLLRVDISNTDPSSTLPANRVRSQITVPVAISSVASSGHILATGWTIEGTPTAASIRIRNTGTTLLPGITHTSYISINGNAAGGDNIQGVISFPLGAPTTPPDNSGDNSSTSPIVVSGTIPVILSELSVSSVSCEPVIKWATENEVNSEKFEVERLLVNRNNGWIVAGTIQASGNSSIKKEYSFTDKAAAKLSDKVLYRLKMVDMDGKYTYSKTESIALNCNTSNIIIYPNPVFDGKIYTEVKTSGAITGFTSTLYDLSGKKILSSSTNSTFDYIDVSQIPNGIYIINVTDLAGLNTKRLKVIIQN